MGKAREYHINPKGTWLKVTDLIRNDKPETHVHVIEKSAYLEACEEIKKLREALEKIVKYKFRGSGPSGCDSHCINHPCGPCADLPNEKWIAKKALKETGSEDE